MGNSGRIGSGNLPNTAATRPEGYGPLASLDLPSIPPALDGMLQSAFADTYHDSFQEQSEQAQSMTNTEESAKQHTLPSSENQHEASMPAPDASATVDVIVSSADQSARSPKAAPPPPP